MILMKSVKALRILAGGYGVFELIEMPKVDALTIRTNGRAPLS